MMMDNDHDDDITIMQSIPPPRCKGSSAITASRILNLTFLIGSSHNGPSRVPHWKPWTIESLTELSNPLSTSEGNVSSTKMFGPVESGPKAQIERAASKSQSYFVWKNSPKRFLEQG